MLLVLFQVEETAHRVDADDDPLRADIGVHVVGRDGGVVDVLPLPVGPHRRLPRPRPRVVHLRLGAHPHCAGSFFNYFVILPRDSDIEVGLFILRRLLILFETRELPDMIIIRGGSWKSRHCKGVV